MTAPAPRNPLVGLLTLSAIATAGTLGWWGWQQRQTQPEGPPLAATAQTAGIPVRIVTVPAATIEDRSAFVGTLVAERASEIRTEASGRVQELFVSEGQAVTEGEPIARLASEKQQADLEGAQADIRAAIAARESLSAEIVALKAERPTIKAEIDFQTAQLDRVSGLAQEGAIASQQLDIVTRDLDIAHANSRALERRIEASQERLAEADALLEQRQATAERTRRELQDTALTAPFDGTIDTLAAKVGDLLADGDILANLVSNQTLELQLSVPIEQADRLRLGLPVRLTDEDGAAIANGSIFFISPQVDPQSQVILTKARFSNPDSTLRNGQFVRAEAIWETRPNRPVVPVEAILSERDTNYAYIARRDGDRTTVERRQVQTGIAQGDRVEVLAGLSAGEEIVVSGIQRLSDGSTVILLDSE